MFRENTPAGSEAQRRFVSIMPMKRLARPDEIAAAVAFLLLTTRSSCWSQRYLRNAREIL